MNHKSGKLTGMAESVVQIASYICERYQKEFGTRIDEMKLHKLLYFTQRECLIQTGKPMFEEAFSAWKYGPVLVSVRQLYKRDSLRELPSENVIAKYKKVFDKVFFLYAPKTSLSLSVLSHNEYSWKHAFSLKNGASDALIDLHDIEKDAEHVKIRRFLLEKMNVEGNN